MAKVFSLYNKQSSKEKKISPKRICKEFSKLKLGKQNKKTD